MSQDSSPSQKRRRGSAWVTKNACNECRKKKAKCNGQSPCSRCVQGDTTCEYTVSVRTSLDSMKAQIQELQDYRKQTDHVLESLALGAQSDFILRQLQNGVGVREIHDDLLARGVSLEEPSPHSQRSIGLSSISPGTGSLSVDSKSPEVLSPWKSCSPATDKIGGHTHYANEPWTTVTNDSKLIQHLVSLYLCWEHPVFSSLSKEHFIEDFEAQRRRYCSSLLVNVISALGSKFSDRPSVSASENGEGLGERFYAEAERIWEVEQDDPSCTTVQATVLMALWEASRGRNSKSLFYSKQAMTMAIEMGLHSPDISKGLSEAEYEIQSATFWGAFVLDMTWSLNLGQPPHLSHRRFSLRPPVMSEKEEQTSWLPYTDSGVQLESTPQPSNICSVFKSFCELCGIIHRSVHLLHSSGKPLVSQEIVRTYAEYMGWYDALPQGLRRGANSTPAVLFTHMYYYFGILHLFGPFVDMEFLGSGVVPMEIFKQAVEAISALTDTYRRLYSLRRVPCFVPHICLTSSFARLMVTESLQSRPSALTREHVQGVFHLQEMAASQACAGSGINMLQNLLTSLETGQHDKADRWTAALNTSPNALNRFFAQDVTRASSHGSAPPNYPVPWPFPQRVSAFAGSEEDLRSRGFELIDLPVNSAPVGQNELQG